MAVLGKKRRNRHDDALDAADHARIRSHRAGAGGRRRAGKNHTRAGRSFGRSAERSVFASPGNGYCAAKLPVVGDYFTHLSLLFAANQGEARSRPSRRVYPGNSRVRTACPYPIGSAARKPRAIQSSALRGRAAHGRARTADITFCGACSGNHPVRPRTHLLRRLPTWASIPEDQPALRSLVDLLGCQSLIFAVVPLDQVVIYDGWISETCEFTCLPRPLHWATENERKRVLGEHRSHSFGKPAPAFGQGDVCRPGVLAAQAPRRLAMSDREKVQLHLLGGQTLSASVERTPADAASCPHLQPEISGMSSPYRAMYSRCSMSLSRIACFA